MPFLILGGVLLLILVAVLLAGRWVFEKAFYVPEHKKMADPRDFYSTGKDAIHKPALVALVDELEPRPFEAVSITSRDGLRLTGRYYHTADGAPLKFIFHGWRSNVRRDCGGGAKMAFDAGYNLLLVNQRAHGDSDGNVITFGIKEKYDCLDWINYAVDRFGKDVTFFKTAGGFKLSVRVMLSPNFYGWLLGFGSEVKVISPSYVVDEVVCRLDEIKKAYKG